ncbi:BREX-1 system phosphatase PglZ type A [Fusobacterium sp. PH5-44]|uniref:BREX-1 system phosphatase PglZ type A n=1 Tax=unclassified Fusobacterium TaxID=2648384 RepID=UPI003D1A1CDC
MEKEKIKDMLDYRFNQILDYPKKRRIIFWYDAEKSFKDIIENLELSNAKVIILSKKEKNEEELIDTNIFATKYSIEVEDTESNFLLYSEYQKPKDDENYLIDIEYYSEFFEADKSAMIVEELGFDRTNYQLREMIKENSDFFANKDRKSKLLKVIENPKLVNEKNLKLFILAAISGSHNSDILEILRNIIMKRDKLVEIERWVGSEFLFDQINKKFEIEVTDFDQLLKIFLVVHFYREIQKKAHVNLEKYAKGKTNDIFVFVDSLLLNVQTAQIMKENFHHMGEQLILKDRIDELELEDLSKGKGVEYLDKRIIRRIAENLGDNLTEYDKYLEYIDRRLNISLWKDKYLHFYNALSATINLFKLKSTMEVKDRDNLREVFEDYTKKYYLIDELYRKFYYSYDKIKNDHLSKVFDRLENKILYFYEKEYLEILLPIWSEKISDRKKLPQQSDFYMNYIEKSDTRVAVIISDGLRYEIGKEICLNLEKESNAEIIQISGLIAELPTKTYSGMVNLLPNVNRAIMLDTEKATVDGIDTSTLANRGKILDNSKEGSIAVAYDNFNKMKKSEQEAFIKGKKVIYIYHNSIDETGDAGLTENRTFDACHTAVRDITSMTKSLSSLGVVNIFITSDHGFIYERNTVLENNKLELTNTNYTVIGKRYGISAEEVEERGCITVHLGNWYGIFPHKNQRIKSSGGGLQYIHGGISPQEMIVPLVHYKGGAKVRKPAKVNVKIKENIGKITSNLTKFSLYQTEAVSIKDKLVERNVLAALYSGNEKVSNFYPLKLNATEENHIYNFSLTLTGDHKKVVLKVMDTETEDILDTKEYAVNIGIALEFDF